MKYAANCILLLFICHPLQAGISAVDTTDKTSSAALQNKALVALEAGLKKQPLSHWHIKPVSQPKESSIKLTELRAKWDETYPPAKRICVRLMHDKTSIPVWFSIKAYKKVLVANHKLSPHRQAAMTDFSLQNRNIAGLTAKPYTLLPANNWLKKSVNANQIITDKDLMPPPLVVKGQTIQVIISSPGVRIITQAIAEKEAYLGDTISLMNPQSKTHFTALISGKNRAELAS